MSSIPKSIPWKNNRWMKDKKLIQRKNVTSNDISRDCRIRSSENLLFIKAMRLLVKRSTLTFSELWKSTKGLQQTEEHLLKRKG